MHTQFFTEEKAHLNWCQFELTQKPCCVHQSGENENRLRIKIRYSELSTHFIIPNKYVRLTHCLPDKQPPWPLS